MDCCTNVQACWTRAAVSPRRETAAQDVCYRQGRLRGQNVCYVVVHSKGGSARAGLDTGHQQGGYQSHRVVDTPVFPSPKPAIDAGRSRKGRARRGRLGPIRHGRLRNGKRINTASKGAAKGVLQGPNREEASMDVESIIGCLARNAFCAGEQAARRRVLVGRQRPEGPSPSSGLRGSQASKAGGGSRRGRHPAATM